MSEGTSQITVNCSCGKRLKAPASAAGKRAKCPACGNVLTIEAPPPPEDDFGALYDLAEKESEVAARQEAAAPSTMRCPSCGSALAPGAVLCVNCGYDMRAKGKVKPKVESAAAPAGKAAVGFLPYAKKEDAPAAAGEGNYFLGIALGFGFGIVGAIICCVIWYFAADFPFTGWLVLLIGAAAGFGMNMGHKANSHFSGMTAAGITFIISIIAHFALPVMMVAHAVNHASSSPSAQTSSQAAEDDEDTKDELSPYMTQAVLKERGIKPESATEKQMNDAEAEGDKRLNAMTASQRSQKLADFEKQEEQELAKVAHSAPRNNSSNGSGNSNSAGGNSGGGGVGGGIWGFAILLAVALFLWAMIPTFVAMAVAWKIAAGS